MEQIDKSSESFKILNELNFCVIDLETTGGNHESDRIIEIGMVKIRNLEIKDELSIIVDPGIQIPDFIQKLTSIKQKDTKGQPKISEVIDKVTEFIGDDILVAHNTSFDIPFLNGVLKRLGKKELKNKVICTNVMTKHLIPDITSSNLAYMSSLFELNHNQAHRALDDAIASGELLIEYCKIFINKGIKKVNQLYYPKNKFELDRIHLDENNSKEDILNKISLINSSASITFKGKQGLILAIIPSESLAKEKELIEKYIETLDWKMITIKISKPFLETLLYFCSHYQKFTESIQTELKSYVRDMFECSEISTSISSLDFILSNHLIREQVIAYSFLNMNSKTHNIFKVPAQQKKMYQYLISNTNRFENNQKGVRKTFIPKELESLVECYLSSDRAKGSYLYISRKDIKNGREHFISILNKYTTEVKNDSSFPSFHL